MTRRAVLAAAVRAELVKATSTRPVVACLAVTVVAAVAISALAARARPSGTADAAHAASGTLVLPWAVTGFVAFGVLLVSGEYTSGLIRVSLVAVPRRAVLAAAELAAAVLLAGAAALVEVPASALVAQLLTAGEAGVAGGGAPVSLPALAGAAAYLTLAAVVAAGVTLVLRSQPAALGVLLPWFGVASPLLAAAGGLVRYLPDQAGLRLADATSVAQAGPPLAVLLVWTAATAVAGAAALRYRDA